MQTNEVTLGALERRIDMAVSLADIEQGVAERLKRLSRTVKMAGFRPGKVPMRMVEQTYGGQVRSEVIGEHVERKFNEGVREQKLRVAGYPKIEPKEASAEGTLEFSATFEVMPEVVIGSLAEQAIERPALTVGDAEVDSTIEVLRKQRAVFQKVERASAAGDQVVIDFTGRKDGEVFQGGQAEDFSVVVGGGQMLPDFDAQLVGISTGVSKTFDLTFPADYQAKELAGQTVQFEITCKSVEEAVLPAVDETFAKAMGVDDGDIAKMRAEIKENLEREVARRVRVRMRDQAFDALIAVTPMEVPKAMIEAEAEQMAEAAKRDLASRGMDVKNIPVQPAWFIEQATRRAKLGLIVSEVVVKNELKADADKVRARVDEIAASYEDPSSVVSWYYSKPENLQNIEDVVVEENVVAWVLAQAKTTDRAVTLEELMAQPQQQ
ncbi:trigger factor [Uliginosibacterium gangwonense]|uniref:trigger factor n=1 Tax=Uliginosibacterium gangwonense TaxID=392736 RepID=UPI00037ADF8D|nr:trigger factor [Uliginosibacterium gangwonense]